MRLANSWRNPVTRGQSHAPRRETWSRVLLPPDHTPTYFTVFPFFQPCPSNLNDQTQHPSSSYLIPPSPSTPFATLLDIHKQFTDTPSCHWRTKRQTEFCWTDTSTVTLRINQFIDATPPIDSLIDQPPYFNDLPPSSSQFQQPPPSTPSFGRSSLTPFTIATPIRTSRSDKSHLSYASINFYWQRGL